jgi:hypothetical protein
MNEKPIISRRDFLKLSGLSAASLMLPRTPDPGENEAQAELNLIEPEYTPQSLMLHSANLPLLIEGGLINEIKKEGLETATYAQLYDSLLSGKTQKNQILLSIDDLSPVWLRKDFKLMIEQLESAGMIGTLALITGKRKDGNPEIWHYLKNLAEKGWEIAIHGKEHFQFTALDNETLKTMIVDPFNDITREIGISPKTLILPFGAIAVPGTEEFDQRIFDVSGTLGIKWVVGIAGGKTFVGKPPYFVGRIPPGEDGVITAELLKNSFDPTRKY